MKQIYGDTNRGRATFPITHSDSLAPNISAEISKELGVEEPEHTAWNPYDLGPPELRVCFYSGNATEASRFQTYHGFYDQRAVERGCEIFAWESAEGKPVLITHASTNRHAAGTYQGVVLRYIGRYRNSYDFTMWRLTPVN